MSNTYYSRGEISWESVKHLYNDCLYISEQVELANSFNTTRGELFDKVSLGEINNAISGYLAGSIYH